jgi:hypothetical protein
MNDTQSSCHAVIMVFKDQEVNVGTRLLFLRRALSDGKMNMRIIYVAEWLLYLPRFFFFLGNVKIVGFSF